MKDETPHNHAVSALECRPAKSATRYEFKNAVGRNTCRCVGIHSRGYAI
jgi:hypothetical protein